MTHMDSAGGWAAEQLTAFLAAVTDLDDRGEALRCAAERAAEAVEAEVAAFVSTDGVLSAIGFPRDQLPTELLCQLAEEGCGTAEVPGLGSCTTLVVPYDGVDGGKLLVARAGVEPFAQVERNLLRGMCKVLTLSSRALVTIASLRERQTLLERLTRIQRSISLRAPLNEVLEAIVAGAGDLLGDDVVGLRRIDPEDPDFMEMLCSAGIEPDVAHMMRRSRVGEGAGGRAIAEGHLVIVDRYTESPAAIEGFAAMGLQTAMAAPVHEDGHIVGSLVVASRRPDRRYTQAEQDTLAALADHASLALTDARTVQALRDALVNAQHDALHDHLTALPNRALLRDRLDQAVRRAARRGTKVAVLFLDLDGFKRVNDSLGHDAGDALLLTVSERLLSCIRDVDTLARLGGDEFAFLLEDLEDDAPAYEVAARVHTALSSAFDIGFREITLSASIGIALTDSPEATAGELLRNADLAMYQAKGAGKGRHVLFHDGMYAETIVRLELESSLRAALDSGEFFLEYQPIVDLHTDSVTHVEALARWNHPERGRVSPDEFIPVAEATGMIVPLGQWILAEACQQALRWQQPETPVAISVNLSPVEISAELPDNVAAILKRTGLPPWLLTLEITEGLLMNHDDETLDALRRLQAMGVRLSIDDFGTGYSSLARLRDLPVNQLKIDRSFTRAITDPKSGAALVAGVIAIARGLGLSVVAEGVETHEQRQMLRRIGCRLAQGYLFGMPVGADEIAELFVQARPVGAAPGNAGHAAAPPVGAIPSARPPSETDVLAQSL
jgi:diguanylate cyclase (GGDEF)-like protein